MCRIADVGGRGVSTGNSWGILLTGGEAIAAEQVPWKDDGPGADACRLAGEAP